jgi:DNA ligase 1
MIKPMLACSVENIEKLFNGKNTYLLSIKLDGIRALAINGEAYSRSGKLHRNLFIQNKFKELNGFGVIFDGELLNSSSSLGNENFASSTKDIMSIKKPIENLKYYIFDIVDTKMSANERYEFLKSIERELPEWCYVVEKTQISKYDDFKNTYEYLLSLGYEGCILQKTNGKYKHGRSTLKEGFSLKVKAIEDSEAKIVGFIPLYRNENISFENELGYSKKSSAQDGLVQQDTLGSLIMQTCDDEFFEQGIEFKIGTGFDDTLRKEIWDNRDYYIGKTVKYKHLFVGVKDKPRNPVFIGFRDEDDMEGDNNGR